MTKRPTEEEFWNSNQEYLFRIECTEYADWRKFKIWITEYLKKAENQNSIEEVTQEKMGKFETYDDYDKKYEILRDVPVFKYTKEFYLFPGEKYEIKSKYHERIQVSKHLGDEYLKKWTYAGTLTDKNIKAK